MNAVEYVRAHTVADALQKVGTDGRFLGGGTNLVDLMKYGVEDHPVLVDVTRLPLNKIQKGSKGGLVIGALVRNSDLAADSDVRKLYPALSQALLNGASPQLRNMATTGGNLMQRTRCGYFYDTAFPCNKREPGSGCPAIKGINRMHSVLGGSDQCIAAHPSDMAVALAMLDAVVHVEGKNGARAIPIADFHRLPGSTPERDTNLEQGELIVSVELPPLPVAKTSGYVKVRDRNSYAFALVAVAAALHTENGVIREARFALGGVAPKPWRAKEAEAALIGQPNLPETYRKAADLAMADAKGYGHNDFKIELAKRTIVRAFGDLAGGNA